MLARNLVVSAASLLIAAIIGSCSAETVHTEGTRQGLSRCSGGINGDDDYCSPGCPCPALNGDCDTNADCDPGNVCMHNQGLRFGFPSSIDVCAPATCANQTWDVGECGQDCGGTSQCGTCVVPRASKGCGGVNGEEFYCDNPNFPCTQGEGDCETNANCAGGLTCANGVGAAYGLPAGTDVCVGSSCSNGTWDADECGVDCGGTSVCQACTVSRPSKSCGGVNGGSTYCENPNNRCGLGEGDCDGDSDCLPGLTCAQNAGAPFGLPANTDVCVAGTCGNGTWDVGECGVDCGGTSGCPACSVTRASKGCGGVNGGDFYCDNPTQPCASGEGDCETNADCMTGLSCRNGVGVDYGLPAGTDVCVGNACVNGTWDVNECGVDCGGATSGCPSCSVPRPSKGCAGINGGDFYCDNPGVLCGHGEGDCETNANCMPGLTCVNGVGAAFGLPPGTDVCVSNACSNGIWDSNECGIDCGGTSGCGTCTTLAASKGCGGLNGDDAFCTNPNQPCGVGEGDCDGTSQCAGGLTCANSAGAAFGLPAGTDVCIASTCSNLVQDPGEAGVDCGGPCPACVGLMGTPQWATSATDADEQQMRAIATDSAGNVYVVGYFVGTTTVAGSSLTSLGSYDIFVASYNSAGTPRWVQRFGGAGSEFGVGLAASPSGDVIVTGYYSGTVNFGGSDLIAMSGDQNAFLLKLSGASGSHIWSRSYGDEMGGQQGWAVATDVAGNIAFAGQFNGPTDFGGGTIATAAGWSIFLMGVDANGNHTFSRGFGTAASSQNFCRSVDVSSTGDIVISGRVEGGAVDFGGGSRTLGGGRDAYVAQFNSAGGYEWDVVFGDAAEQQARRVAYDSSNRVIVASWFLGSANLGCGAITSTGGTDLMLARLSTTGTCDWSISYGGGGDQFVDALSVDATDRIVVGGFFSGNANLGGAVLSSSGSTDLFMAKYSNAGAHLWSKRFGDSGTQVGVGVATDGVNNSYFVGHFDGSITSGASTLTANGRDGYLLSFAP